MILEALFNLLSGIINLIPFNLPTLPSEVNTTLEFIFNGILGSLGLINIFINLRLWISCAVAMTVIYNIKRVWNGFIWVLNLIPTVQISYWK